MCTQGKLCCNKMPESLRTFFWDTDFDNLDLQENKYYIISRLYVKGNLKAIRWVNETYTDEDIKETARTRRALDPIVANYLRQKCGLKREEMAYYRNERLGGRELWNY